MSGIIRSAIIGWLIYVITEMNYGESQARINIGVFIFCILLWTVYKVRQRDGKKW